MLIEHSNIAGVAGNCHRGLRYSRCSGSSRSLVRVHSRELWLFFSARCWLYLKAHEWGYQQPGYPSPSKRLTCRFTLSQKNRAGQVIIKVTILSMHGALNIDDSLSLQTTKMDTRLTELEWGSNQRIWHGSSNFCRHTKMIRMTDYLYLDTQRVAYVT
jgi:hypothetical protein